MLSSLLLAFFASPTIFVRQATAKQWTIFLQQARQQGLTARFYYVLQTEQLLDHVPLKVKLHGESGARYALKQQHSLYAELQQLETLFAAADYPCLLLKGAAYRAQALKVSFGRLFSDIDILVPATKLRQVRDRLFFCGFREAQMTDYDRHYYLNWSHQNPPIQHYQRGTVIDLHHHIYPTASAKTIDITSLYQYAVSIPGSAFKVPTIAHLFIHAAVHLFYQEETHKLTKDVIDLNDLLLEVQYQQQLDFMLEQAVQMSVQSAVINACWILRKLFNNAAAQTALQTQTNLLPQPLVCNLLLTMLQGAPARAWIARQFWFLRGHSLKMRWQVLVYHSLAKPISGIQRWFRRWLPGDKS